MTHVRLYDYGMMIYCEKIYFHFKEYEIKSNFNLYWYTVLYTCIIEPIMNLPFNLLRLLNKSRQL